MLRLLKQIRYDGIGKKLTFQASIFSKNFNCSKNFRIGKKLWYDQIGWVEQKRTTFQKTFQNIPDF